MKVPTKNPKIRQADGFLNLGSLDGISEQEHPEQHLWLGYIFYLKLNGREELIDFK